MSEKIEKFEDLIAWQKARMLTREIYKITRHAGFAKDFGLQNQIQRAAVSIMSNIAEGFERYNPNEFHHFFPLLKHHVPRYVLNYYVALDVDYLDADQFSSLLDLAKETGRIIGGLRVSVEKRRTTG